MVRRNLSDIVFRLNHFRKIVKFLCYNHFARTLHFSAGDESKARFQASLDGIEKDKAVESLRKTCLRAVRKPWTFSPGKLIIQVMLILGIDPGTATTGFGLIQVDGKSDRLQLLHFGWIKTDKDELREKRLVVIYKEIAALLKKHKPDILAIERLFFATNAKTAMAVSEATGVIRLAAAKNRVPVVDYAPMQVKMVICGSGKADKNLVKKEVRKLLSFRSPNHKKTHFDDVCDALAVAICHVRKTCGKIDKEV